MDLKEKRITVIGDADPVILTNKLRKCRFTELVSVNTFREEQKRYSDEMGGSDVYSPLNRCSYANSNTPSGGFYALTDGDHYSY